MARFTAVLESDRVAAHEGIELAGRWLSVEVADRRAVARSRSRRSLAVCDGQLFATDDLTRELGLPRDAGPGALFAEGIERHGVDFLSRVRGGFSLLFVRSMPPELLLARDRVGLRSLFVSQQAGGIAAASALRPLLAHRDADFELDRQGLARFLLFGDVPPPRTIAAGVTALLPGSWRRWGPGAGWESGRWWSLAPSAPDGDEPDAEDVRGSLLEALRAQMHGVDRPAVFASGGIDSSALLVLLRELGCPRLHTVSLVLTGPDRDLSEGDAARRIADHCHATHVEASIDRRAVASCLDSFFAAMDQPTIDGLNTFLVARAAAQHGLATCFAGFGGDELFAGYPAFSSLRRSEVAVALLARAPLGVRRAAGRAIGGLAGQGIVARKASHFVADVHDRASLYALRRALFLPDQIERLCGVILSLDAEVAEAPGRDRIACWSALELGHRVPDTLLRCSDVFAGAAGVEVRLPFLDHGVVERVLAVPGRKKLSLGGPKPLLRAALRGRLPRWVWKQPKRHFHVPLDRWLDRSWVGRPDLSPWLDPREVERIVTRFERAPDLRSSSRVFALVALERVLRALTGR